MPLRVELVVTADGFDWRWRGFEIERPRGEPRTEPCTFRADMIVAVVERLVVLKILERTPL